MSFAKNRGTHISNEYSQNLLDSAKKSTANAIKTASKRAVQKTAEATGDLIGKNTADKITSVSIESSKEFHSQNENELEIQKEIYISRKKATNY